MGISSQSSIQDLQKFCKENIKKGFKVKNKKYKDYSELKKESLKVTKTISKKYFNKFANLQKTLADYWNNSLTALEKSPDEKNKFEQKFKNKVQVLSKEINNVAVSRDADSNSFLSAYKSQLGSWNTFEQKSNLLEESFEIIKNLEVEKIDGENQDKITFLLEAVDNILNFEEITKETYKSNKDGVNKLIQEMKNSSRVWKKGNISENQKRKTNIRIGFHRKVVEIGGKKYSNYKSIIKAAKDKLDYLYEQSNFMNLESNIDTLIGSNTSDTEKFKKLNEIKYRLNEISSIKSQFNKLKGKEKFDKLVFSRMLENNDYKSKICSNQSQVPECPLTLSVRILEDVLYTQAELDELSQCMGYASPKVNK